MLMQTKTLGYNEICPFSINYEYIADSSNPNLVADFDDFVIDFLGIAGTSTQTSGHFKSDSAKNCIFFSNIRLPKYLLMFLLCLKQFALLFGLIKKQNSSLSFLGLAFPTKGQV
jgi:hypothetical protein